MKMQRSLAGHATLLCIVAIATSARAVASEEVALASRRREEYPVAEAYWTNLLSNISCDVLESSNERKRNYELFCKGEAGGYVRSELTPAGLLQQVHVWTPSKSFRLESSPKVDSYRIVAAANAGNEDIDFDRARVRLIFESDSRLKSMIQVLDTPLSEMLSRAVPFSVIERGENRPELPEFEFDYSDLDSNFNTVKVTLDRENHWALTSWIVDFKPTSEGISRTTAEITYEMLADSRAAFPKTIREVASLITDTEAKEVQVRTATLTNIQFGNVQDSEFQLETYGMPDVLNRTTRPRYPFDSLSFWCALSVGIVTLGIFWRMRKRDQRQ